MSKQILFLIGKPVGIDAVNFLKSKKEFSIEVWSSENKIINKKNFNKYFNQKKNFINYFKKNKKVYDFIILVYWPWIIPDFLFDKFNNSVNFHPSFLPIGRGAYPHVHAIIKKFKWGVTLHKIFPGIDNGDIWCQKRIKIEKFSNATQLYIKSREEIIKLFKKNIINIIDGKVKPKKQKGEAIILFKKDLHQYDKLELKKKYLLDDLINISNARSFAGKTFNFFYYKKKKYSFDITVKRI
jgi:methionyl-tRNA formyltransferase